MSKLFLLDNKKIKKRLGIGKDSKVQKYFQSQCYRYMYKYVPFDKGNLARDSVDLTNSKKIVFKTPYAHYMYLGMVMGPNFPIYEKGQIIGWYSKKGKKKHYTGKSINYSLERNAFAGPYWDKRMWSAEKHNIMDKVNKYIRKVK